MQLIRRPVVLVPVAALGVLIVVSGLYLFQPWKLFTNTTVDEASPIAVSASAQSTAQAPTPMPSASETSARSAAMVSATAVVRNRAEVRRRPLTPPECADMDGLWHAARRLPVERARLPLHRRFAVAYIAAPARRQT